MAIIEVNHQQLRTMAQAIESYCDLQNTEITKADTAVKDMLANGWNGEDALEFGAKWEGVDASDASSKKFCESLKKFSEALYACADCYRVAQEDAVNLANLLPRW